MNQFLDDDGRLKRIEYRGQFVRASRTGGVSVRAQTKVAGVNLTANTKHGFRASTRVAKGTNAGFQNGRFFLRGRYGKGPTKLNVSKSGFSISSKTSVGTVNWMKPRFSSAKIAGIQVRGDKALLINAVVALVQLAIFALVAAFYLVTWSLQLVFWVAGGLIRFIGWLWSRRNERLEAQQFQDRSALLGQYDELTLIATLAYGLVYRGGGVNEPPPGFTRRLLYRGDTSSLDGLETHEQSDQEAMDLFNKLFEEAQGDEEEKLAQALESVFGVLVERSSEETVAECLVRLDDYFQTQGWSTELQRAFLLLMAEYLGLIPDTELLPEEGPEYASAGEQNMEEEEMMEDEVLEGEVLSPGFTEGWSPGELDEKEYRHFYEQWNKGGIGGAIFGGLILVGGVMGILFFLFMATDTVETSSSTVKSEKQERIK